MRMLALLALCACEAEGEFEPWHGEEDGSALLFDQPHHDLVHRARIFDADDLGEARTVSGGEPLSRGDDHPFELDRAEFVVVDSGERVRITWSSSQVQLLLWLDRQALDDVIAVPTVGTALQPRGDGVVHFPAGLSVEPVDYVGDRTVIEVEVDNLLIGAAVPHADVDQVWEAFHADDTRSALEVRLQGPILDGPHGEPLAWPLLDEGVIAETRGEPLDHHHPITWSSSGVTVEGWVYQDDVMPLEGNWGYGGSGVGWGCGHGCYGAASRTNVPANTPLRSEPDGPVVGRTLRARWVTFARDGWGPMSATTPWGEAELWVDELALPEPDDADPL